MGGFNYGAPIEGQPANDIGGGKDIRRSHRWRIASIVGSKPNSDLPLYAKSFTPPQVDFETEQAAGTAHTYKFAAKANFPDVTVVFYDVDGIYETLQEMAQKVWTPSRGIAAANEYKDTSSFILESPDSAHLKISLINSWIKGLSHSELTYEANEFKVVNVTLSYDWYETSAEKNTRRSSDQPNSAIQSGMTGRVAAAPNQTF